jgi:hypothetical protein
MDPEGIYGWQQSKSPGRLERHQEDLRREADALPLPRDAHPTKLAT